MMSFFLSHVLTDISENLFLSAGQNIATFTIFYKYLKEANIQNIIRKHEEDEKECQSKIIYVRGNWKKVLTISWVDVNNLRELIQLKFFWGLYVSLFIFCVFCIINTVEQIAYSNETQSADQKSLHVLHATTCLLTVFLVI